MKTSVIFNHLSKLKSNSPLAEECPQGGVATTPQHGEIILTAINNIPIIRNFVENLP
ncbi:MAG: hypothetical protein PHW92_11435 [Lutibacter sp.]|nr:hypothetical protein [Lutibacter sp.]